MTPRGFDRPLYLLPFDHRGTFQTKMFGWTGTLSPEQTAEIAVTKQVIYDAFKAALAAGVPEEKAGILVDIRTLGKRAGVVINPATPGTVLEEILPDVERALVMTVDPGFGHQHFLETTRPKSQRVREMIERVKSACDLGVDGGIDAATARLAVEAGANILVAGSAI